jgi:hypothetical protein
MSNHRETESLLVKYFRTKKHFNLVTGYIFLQKNQSGFNNVVLFVYTEIAFPYPSRVVALKVSKN